MNRTATAAVFAAGSLVVLGFGGAALAGGAEGVRPGALVSPSTTVSEPAGPSGAPSPAGSSTAPAGGDVTADEARAIALRAVPGGTVESVEQETEHGRLVWEVDVLAGGVEHDLDVDATTGEVTRHETDDDSDSDDSDSDDNDSDDDDNGRDDD
ncbi:PepSY domain-containing protein [Actinoplanes sp. NPDC049802]|uniref:PepSY domain-containing protein n=1 Tax=Actinoplanes sp. NPDC049802 TaxID=3154742 RepID=UPI0033F992E7